MSVDFSDAFDKVRDTVVRVTSYVDGFEVMGKGSGVLVANGKHVITCVHCIEKDVFKDDRAIRTQAKRVTISFSGEADEYSAEIGPMNREHDWALLTLSDSLPTREKPINTAVIEHERNLKVGQEVFLAGYPFGRSTVLALSGNIAGFEHSEGLDYIVLQSDANTGNSGGPLFTLDGKLIGIVQGKIVNSANIFSPETTCYYNKLIDSLKRQRGLINSADATPARSTFQKDAEAAIFDIITSIRKYMNVGLCMALPIKAVNEALQPLSLDS